MLRFNIASAVVLGALASVACGGPEKPATNASDASGLDPAGTRNTGTSLQNPADTTGTNTGPGTGTDGNAPAGMAPIDGAGTSSGAGVGPGSGTAPGTPGH
jgi:hypothetical protein